MIKYHCSFLWGCQRLPWLERIRRTLKKPITAAVLSLINVTTLGLLVWIVVNTWIS